MRVQYHFGIVGRRPGVVRGWKYIHSMGSWENPEQAANATVKRLQIDRKFRERWMGHQFLPVVLDCMVEIDQSGAIVRHLNEVEQKA